MDDFDSLQQSGRFFSALARDLKSQALSNIQFFQDGKQSHHAKFHTSFCLLYDYLDLGIEPSFRELSNYVHLFDFSREMKGNGFRSLLHVVQKCCLHLLQLVRYISNMRDSILFRKKFYAQELEAYVSAIGQLRAVLYYALKLLNYCEEGCLFTDNDVIDNEVAQSLMLEIEELNQECFYGRCLGFQFCSSMVRPLQALGIAMASYSEAYLETSSMMQMATSVFNSGKYFLDPELRAEQIVKATRTSDIRFCKALWGLTETGLMLQLPAFVCPSVEVDEAFPLGPDAFELPLEDGSDTVVITPPCAHTGPGHVYVRLISSHLRDGQQSLKKAPKSKTPPSSKPRTDGLVIHIHGGGFVAHSSKSHEVYLRDWAHVFNVPILSIDYSLSPEMPFPRALEECFYAYAWAVKNCEQLGSTGKSIVLVGDSAGGNLSISTAMRAASFGIRRPEGVVSIYGVTMVSYTPSPARLLSLMDPLLSFGLVSRCLAAYAGVSEEHPLATPQTEDLHSKASLSSLKMETMEATDQEWIIIAQNQQECMEIDQKLVASPVNEPRERSVVDSLEDSFHGDCEEERKLERSDTVESEEVEIFSQLAAAGSCVFPKEAKKVKSDDAGKDRNSNTQSQDFQDHVINGKKTACNSSSVNGLKSQDGKSITTLGGIQETAKSVVAGAQSMFSSLSSYIPKRSKMNASGVLSPVTYDVPAAITPDIDCFVDLSYNSDPVDISANINGMELSEGEVVSDSSQNVSELKSGSKTHLNENGGYFPKMSIHMDCASPESEVIDEGALFSPSNFIQDADISERETTADSKRSVAGSELKDGSDLSASNSMSSLKESKGQSENSDSCAFKSALQSPVPGLSMQAMSLSCLESPAVIDVNMTPMVDNSKPTLGMSPNADIVPISADNDPQDPTSIPTLCDNGVTASLSSHPTSNTAFAKQECHRSFTEVPSSSHANNNLDISLTAESNGPISLQTQALSPIHPPSFSQDDFTCDTNSLRFMPSLPPENKELLEDAIEAADFWGEEGADCSSEKQQALSHFGKERSVPAEKGLELNQLKNDGHAKTNDSEKISSEDGNKTVHDVLEGDAEIDVAKLPSTEKQENLKSNTIQSTIPCHSAARPPSELKLASTTSAILPGPSQATIDSVLSSEEPDFDRSCLEFLTPSSTLNDGCPGGQGQMTDGIFRSESAPALSSLLTPSPSSGANPAPVPRQSGLNGLKMGMSPSDFKRRIFTTQSPLKTMKKATVVKNPYMSPFLATEELLRGLPPVTLVASHLDPLLDDSIMFAKRLKSFDMPVDLHLVDDLPHGFLNFSLISSEAKQASHFCAQKVLDLLEKSV